MRTSRSALLASLVLAFGLALQVPLTHAAAIGVVAGINRGGVNGDAPENVEFGSRIGVIAGVQGEVGIAEDVLLSVQPMFVSRGASISNPDSLAEEAGTLAIDYIAVPILLKIVAGGGRTFVTGGIDIAFLDAATLSFRDQERDATDLFPRTDVSALLGFGVVFPIGRPRLTLEARYVQAFTKMPEEGVVPPDQNLPDRFHNTGLQFTAGFLYPLGRP